MNAPLRIKSIGSNQTELHLNNGTIVLFSYETPVAAKVSVTEDGILIPNTDSDYMEYIKTKTKYSRTTSKHLTQWLNHHFMPRYGREVDQSVLDNLV